MVLHPNRKFKKMLIKKKLYQTKNCTTKLRNYQIQ